MKNKKIVCAILIGVLILSVCLIGFFIIKSKENKSSDIIEREVVNNTALYMKINPLIKIIYDEKYKMCNDEICSEVFTSISEMILLSDDAKKMFENVNINGLTVYEGVSKLINIAKQNKTDLSKVDLYYESPNFKIDRISISDNITIGGGYSEMFDVQALVNNKKQFSITYNTNGGTSILKEIVFEGDKAIRPVDPKKDGYTFVEWQLDNKKYDFSKAVYKDIVLIAVWKENKKDSQESSQNIVEVKKWKVKISINSEITEYEIENGKVISKMPDLPTVEGMEFAHWLDIDDNIVFDPSTKINKNYNIKAVYEKKNTEEVLNSTCVVTFNTDGGTSVPKKTIKCGEQVPLPNPTTKKGYIFVEWQLNGKKYDFNSKVNSDIELISLWRKVTIPNIISTTKTELSNGNMRVVYEYENSNHFPHTFVFTKMTVAPGRGTFGIGTTINNDASLTSVEYEFAYGFFYNISVTLREGSDYSDEVKLNVDLRPKKISEYTVTYLNEKDNYGYDTYKITAIKNNDRDEGLAYILCSANGTSNCIVRTSKNNTITISARDFISNKVYLSFYVQDKNSPSLYGYNTDVIIKDNVLNDAKENGSVTIK